MIEKTGTETTGASKSNRKVVVLGSTAKGEAPFRLDKTRIVFGAVISSDVRLTGEGVSPIHAVLEITQDVSGNQIATIYDLASMSGVFVNGSKVLTQTVKNGDEIVIGKHHLKFQLEEMEKVSLKERVWESEGRKLFLDPNEDFSPLLLEDEREVEEIFDYRPSSKPALEVIMSWLGTILDVEHFVKEKEVTIGNIRKSHFGIPPLLATKQYAIVTRSGEGFTLNLLEGMKGVMQRKGELKSFDEITRHVPSSGGGFHVPIEKDDFAKVTIGDIDFYLSYTAAPPKLKRSRLFEKDPFFMKILTASMLMTAVMLTALMNANVPQTLEAEQIPERIATILYQPEKFVPKVKVEATDHTPVTKKAPPVPKAETPPKPKPKPTPKPTVKLDIKPNPVATPRPVPKEMDVTKKPQAKAPVKPAPQAKPKAQKGQSEAKEGEGARAKGEEGSRGSKNAAANKQKQTAASRPSPQGGKGRGAGDSQVPDEGNVDFLKGAGAKIENILGNSAAHLGKGGEKLKGFGGFDTEGNGGLALSGDGKGGGGDAASLGGLGNKGRGGGRVGTGMGAAGNGSGIIGGQSRVAIRSGGPEEAVVMGAIDANAVEAALLAHRDEFRLCYEKEINAETPRLAGRVGTSFVIGSSGRVNQAGIESTTLKHPGTERCIVNVIKRIQFPIPRGAGIVQVTYPFKFSPVGN